MRRVEVENGGLDLLLPNAGPAEVRSLDEVTLAARRSSLEVNLTAPYTLAKAAVPRMRERGAPGAVRRQTDARPRLCGAAGHRRFAIGLGRRSSTAGPVAAVRRSDIGDKRNRLAGDRRDRLIVAIIAEQREPLALRSGGDKQVDGVIPSDSKRTWSSPVTSADIGGRAPGDRASSGGRLRASSAWRRVR